MTLEIHIKGRPKLVFPAEREHLETVLGQLSEPWFTLNMGEHHIVTPTSTITLVYWYPDGEARLNI